MRGDFVIQVRTDADLSSETIQGRVEHMDSGRATRFQSVEELVSFVLQTIHQDAAAGEGLSARGLSSKDSSPKDLTKS